MALMNSRKPTPPSSKTRGRRAASAFVVVLDRIVGAIGSWSLFVFPVAVLILIFVVAFAGAVVYDMCDRGRDCGGVDTAVIVVVAIVVLAAVEATFLLFAAGMAYLARLFRRRALERTYRPRRDAVRDWLARGDITRSEYEAIVPPLETVMTGRFAGERVWAASDLLFSLGAASLMIVLVVLFVLNFLALDEGISALVFNVAFWLVAAGVFLVGTALFASSYARRQARCTCSAVDEALENLARKANARRRAEPHAHTRRRTDPNIQPPR